jgi:ParB family chromosome partitioning protein
MNAQLKTTKKAQNLAIETVALDKLVLSPLNPRQEVTEDEIKLLADSILACGLIQNLSGIKGKGGNVEIVAGGRRLRALQIAVKQKPELANVPVLIAPNESLAMQWANAENTARSALHPADEVVAYGKMAKQKMSITDIAKTFAVTEMHVRRRLALSNLPQQVIAALKNGKLTMDQAKIMTLSTDESKVLEALELCDDRHFNEYQLKRFLVEESVSVKDNRIRFIGLDAYKEAGGAIVEDLFKDNLEIVDIELLDKIYDEKLTQQAEQFRKENGWAWVETSYANYISPFDLEDAFKFSRMNKLEGEIERDQYKRYQELEELANADALDEEGEKELAAIQEILDGEFSPEQKKIGGCLVYVDGKGELSFIEGLVNSEGKATAIQLDFIEAPRKSVSDAPKSDYSQKFVEDMSKIRCAAVQKSLLNYHDLVVKLLAYSLEQQVSNNDKPLNVRYDHQNNTPEIEDGFDLPEVLGPQTRKYDFQTDHVKAFAKFREQSQGEIHIIIHEHLVRSFGLDRNPLLKLVENEVQSDLRSVWTPTAESCFKRLKGSLLSSIYKDLLGLSEKDDKFKTFDKAKKGEKVNLLHKMFNEEEYRKQMKLTKDQLAKIDAWVPDCFSK